MGNTLSPKGGEQSGGRWGKGDGGEIVVALGAIRGREHLLFIHFIMVDLQVSAGIFFNLRRGQRTK